MFLKPYHHFFSVGSGRSAFIVILWGCRCAKYCIQYANRSFCSIVRQQVSVARGLPHHHNVSSVFKKFRCRGRSAVKQQRSLVRFFVREGQWRKMNEAGTSIADTYCTTKEWSTFHLWKSRNRKLSLQNNNNHDKDKHDGSNAVKYCIPICGIVAYKIHSCSWIWKKRWSKYK